MRKSTSIIATWAVAVGVALGANAATLTITADQATYTVGDTITLTVSGTPLNTEVESGIFGQMDFDSALVTATLAMQTGMTKTYYVGMPVFGFVTGSWTDVLGVLPVGPGYAIAFNQIEGLPPSSTADPNPQLSTVTLQADAPGIVTVTWATSPVSQALRFFGLTDAPGTSFNIVAIPEPTTAALFSLGLVGIAAVRRRRGAA